MENFTNLYLQKSKNKTWREICKIDITNTTSNILEDLSHLCDLVVKRVVYNIQLIYSRLEKMGYKFLWPDRAFVLADDQQKERIREFEAQHGQLPLFLRTIYTKVQSVDFSQSVDQLTAQSGHPARGLGWHARLILNSLESAEEEWNQMCFENSHELSAGKNFFFWLGATDSNEEPVGYELPSKHVDEIISWDDEKQDLRQLLEVCFAWGGFPVYRYFPDGKHPAGALYGQPDLQYILPDLRDGLLEI